MLEKVDTAFNLRLNKHRKDSKKPISILYIIYIIYIFKVKATKVRNVYKLKGNLKYIFPQIFGSLYEIFYSVYGSNILQKDILTTIIKSKLNEIKV